MSKISSQQKVEGFKIWLEWMKQTKQLIIKQSNTQTVNR